MTGTIDDLNRAITFKEEALSFTPNDHVDRTGSFINLVNCVATRYKHSNSEGDLDQAFATKDEGMKRHACLPIYRVWAAHSKNDAKRATSLLEAAVYLLPLMSPRALKWKDQQYCRNIAFRIVSGSETRLC